MTLNLAAILYALASVESGNDPLAIGAAGERSAWQLTATAWREETARPFSVAITEPDFARTVAACRIRRLEARTPEHTPEALARLWNPGAPADYARRVGNLYRDFLKDHP